MQPAIDPDWLEREAESWLRLRADLAQYVVTEREAYAAMLDAGDYGIDPAAALLSWQSARHLRVTTAELLALSEECMTGQSCPWPTLPAVEYAHPELRMTLGEWVAYRKNLPQPVTYPRATRRRTSPVLASPCFNEQKG